MASRRDDLGSWLEGTPGDPSPEDVSALGLPASGPGSRAPLGRRVVAILVDWVLSMAVAAQVAPDPTSPAPGIFAADPRATLAVFALSTAVLVSTLGFTIGHRLVGVRVVRVRDLAARGSGEARGPARAPGVVAGVVRTLLLCLVIPAVVWDREGRGMHDAAAGTVLVLR
ncbi:RDD family protein [Actinotalea solisilvae]|uniref:RDD family protein n=1 Tax=Actinotalea solisilvae TaxID=2072922 RepID=UPI0018F26499|nr:RDD family protein [Actinotalea solisilvae]